MIEKENQLNEWALVELMGHQRIVGKISEEIIAGGSFLRVDVPAVEENKAFTRFYGSSAIYCISLLAEGVAMGLVRQSRHEPVSRFELPQLAEKAGPDREEYQP
jgi:hypothetical protein